MTPISFEYQLQLDEYVEQFQRVGRKAAIRLYVFYSLMLAFSLFWLTAAALSRNWLFIALWVGLSAWFLRSLLRIPSRLRRVLRPIWEESSAAQKPQQVTISDDGVRWTSIDGDSRFAWSAFTHWQEAERSIILFQGPSGPTALPKRAMQEGVPEHLRAVFHEKIGRTEHGKSRGFDVVR